MTTEHELDEILRRALHTAVDSVEPAGDGLQRIRQQLDKPRYQLQLRLWLTESADLVQLAGIRLAPVAERIRDALCTAWATLAGWLRTRSASGTRPAGARTRHGAAHRSQPRGRFATVLHPTMTWLRPALAVAGAVVIVVAGVFGLAQLRQTVTDISLLTGGNAGPSAHPSGGPAGTGSPAPGLVPPIVPSPSPTSRAPGTRHRATPTPTCTPSASSSPAGTAPTPGGSASPSGTPSPSTSPTGSSTPSPGAGTSGTSGPANSAASSVMPPAALGTGTVPVQLTAICHSAKPHSTSSATP